MASGAQNAWSVTADNNDDSDTAINLRENQAPSTYNNAVRAIMAGIAKWLKDWQGGLVTAGTATAYTLTTNETLTLADGVSVTCRMNVANGTAPTLNVDSTGAVAIQTVQGTAVTPGMLLAGAIYSFTYYASSAAWIVRSAAGGAALPVGAVFDFAGATVPALSLLCYGQAVSRTTYVALFTAIGTTYGVGDGSTTFNLPDCRGRVVAGKDDMGGSSANRLTNQSGGLNGDTLGATGGAETHALVEAENGPHDHDITDPEHTHAWVSGGGIFAVSPGGGLAGGTGAQTTAIFGGNAPSATGITINSAGSGTAHNNVQPTIIFNKCIFAGA